MTSGINTPQDFAIIRHVWRLPKVYVGELNIYMLVKTTVANFLDKYDEVQPWGTAKDSIKIRNAHYECEFVNCGANSLVDLEDAGGGERTLLLSIRANFEKKLHVVLISLPDENYKNDNIPWLE